jgi:hypothetical protein
MLEASFVALVIAFLTIGAVTRRWIVVVFPLVGWPIYYLGMNRGWWLHGTGDGWELIARSMTVIGVVTTAAAVAVARRISPATSHRPTTEEP